MCNTPAKNIGRSRHTSLADPHHWDVVDLHLRYSLIPPHFSPRTRKGATSLASHLLHFFQLQVQQLQGRRKRITQTDISTIHGHCKHAKTRVTHRIIKVAIFACIRIRMRGENLEAAGYQERAWDMWIYLTTLGQESTLRLLTAMLTRSSTRQGCSPVPACLSYFVRNPKLERGSASGLNYSNEASSVHP